MDEGGEERRPVVSHARTTEVSKLSLNPPTILASVLADRGAITSICAHLLNSMCKIAFPLFHGWIHSSSSRKTPSTFGIERNVSRCGCSLLWPARKFVADLVRMTRMERSGWCDSAERMFGSLMVATEPEEASRR